MASILIVDDDGAVQLIMKLLLEREGHRITCANDGATAIRLVSEDEFDLLIVDIFMPGMDGFETMKLVHQHRPDVPIIVISGHGFSSRTASPDFLRCRHGSARCAACRSRSSPPCCCRASRAVLIATRRQRSLLPINHPARPPPLADMLLEYLFGCSARRVRAINSSFTGSPYP